MHHFTDIVAAKSIVKSQAFRGPGPGGNHPQNAGGGLLGPGVYLTREPKKAEGYRKPLGSGPAAGPMLMCRVKLGVCIELRDQPDGSNDPSMKTWYYGSGLKHSKL